MALDGLRGLAVLGVMASHLFPGNARGILAPIGAIFSYGATGVDLFFVLSGFLITGILLDSLDDTGYFRKFYARRALRIFPLYYGVLFVCLVLTPWLGTHWGYVKWVYLFYLQNTDIAGQHEFFKVSEGVSLNHFWSLAIEEQFYLVWPMAVFFIRKRSALLKTCIVMSCVAFCLRLYLGLQGTRYIAINSGTLCRMDALLIGAALAILVHGEYREEVLGSARKLFLITVVALSAPALLRPMVEKHSGWIFAYDAGSLSLTYTLKALGAAALIAWCLRESSLPRTLFENRSLRFFGKYSYGLYVLHFVALPFLLSTLRGWIRVVTPNNKGLEVVGAGLLSFLVAVVAAYVSYNYYEKPFLRLKKYFDYDHAVLVEGAAVLPEPRRDAVGT
jgi:peptidoglycan/LPS O-acetylase OafA/YrhL